mgnify:CR=1 FL=1
MQSSFAVKRTRDNQESVRGVLYLDASETEEIQDAFNQKIPFVIVNANQNPHNITVDFLKQNFPELPVTCFNPESNSEHIQLDDVLGRIQNGEKYRLRADVFLGRQLEKYFNTEASRK